MSSDNCRPRYCFLEKSQIGYGFNLHGEEPRNNDVISESTTFYHVIKSVDDNSPACVGGLKQDDRLIGVNGYYVDTKPHNEVVKLIRGGGSSTWLLVVDRETDEYYFKVAKRKPTFSDSVYGQEDKRGEPVDKNSVPMEEEREELNNGNAVVGGAESGEADEADDGQDGNRSDTAEVEPIPHPPERARRSRDTESEEEDGEKETAKREDMQEHRSQEEEEAVNALVDAVNQDDISKEEDYEQEQEEDERGQVEDQGQEDEEQDEEEEKKSQRSSNNRVSQQSQSDDGEIKTLSHQATRESYFHFQDNTTQEEEKEEPEKEKEEETPVVAASTADAAVEDDGSKTNLMLINMQKAREAARGKRNAAKTAGNWATKYEDFKRL